MRALYEQISNKLYYIDFGQLWEGFERTDFALYDQEWVYLKDGKIKKTDQFMGNTSINFEGKQVAIWHVTETNHTSIDLLTSNIVHEMFHSYQLKAGETRFRSDLEGLAYPLDAVVLNMKKEAFMLLSKACREVDLSKKYEILKSFFSLRRYRFTLLGSYADYEKSIETIEGSAEYIGLMVLKLINPTLYKEKVNKALNRLEALDQGFLEVRRIAYFSGMVLNLIADELGLKFKDKLEPNLPFICNRIDAQVDSTIMASKWASRDSRIDTLIMQREEMIRSEMNAVLNSSMCVEKSGQFKAKAYDPMNMKRLDRLVYHKHFLGVVDDNAKGDILIMKGPIIAESDGKDFSSYHRLFYLEEE